MPRLVRSFTREMLCIVISMLETDFWTQNRTSNCASFEDILLGPDKNIEMDRSFGEKDGGTGICWLNLAFSPGQWGKSRYQQHLSTLIFQPLHLRKWAKAQKPHLTRVLHCSTHSSCVGWHSRLAYEGFRSHGLTNSTSSSKQPLRVRLRPCMQAFSR